jgi:magnesium transporter
MTPNQRVINLLIRLINSGTQSQFKLFFHRYHEVDIADALSELDSEQKMAFFSRFTNKDQVDVFEEMDMESQIELIQNFKLDHATEMIETMDKDDAVDLLEALLDENNEKAQEILGSLDVQDQIQLKRLLSYKEGTAGALMTTDYISIPEDLRVKDALELYKQSAPKENDAAFYLFIVNDHQQIKGVISIRKLLLASSDVFIKEIRNDNPITVHVDADQEDAANIFQKYRSIILPVVDDLDIVLGVITIDDIVDVVVEEANEDILKLSGTVMDDIESDKLIYGNVLHALGHRLPWLCVTIVGGIVASYIMISYSKDLIQPMFSLAFILSFVPLLMGLGGNIGNQSATIIVRALAVNQINKAWHIILREFSIGVILGSFIGGIVGGYIFLTTPHHIMALCIGGTVVINMSVAALLGAALPVLFNSLRIDPAVASAPFISTSLDIIGQIIYFSITLFMFQLFL